VHACKQVNQMNAGNWGGHTWASRKDFWENGILKFAKCQWGHSRCKKFLVINCWQKSSWVHRLPCQFVALCFCLNSAHLTPPQPHTPLIHLSYHWVLMHCACIIKHESELFSTLLCTRYTVSAWHWEVCSFITFIACATLHMGDRSTLLD